MLTSCGFDRSEEGSEQGAVKGIEIPFMCLPLLKNLPT